MPNVKKLTIDGVDYILPQGGSGPWHEIEGATYPCAALLNRGTYVNVISVPIVKSLMAGDTFPTVNYGSPFTDASGNQWYPFEIIDSNFFSFLPSQFLVDDIQVDATMASEGLWTWGFLDSNVVGKNEEPDRRDTLAISGIRCRLGANGLELHVYGAARFNSAPYGPANLIYKFLDQMDFSSETSYLVVNGTLLFTLPA